MNTMLVYNMRDDSYSIETTNHPLPVTARREVSQGKLHVMFYFIASPDDDFQYKDLPPYAQNYCRLDYRRSQQRFRAFKEL